MRYWFHSWSRQSIWIIYSEGRPEKFRRGHSWHGEIVPAFGTWYGVGIEFKALDPVAHPILSSLLERFEEIKWAGRA